MAFAGATGGSAAVTCSMGSFDSGRASDMGGINISARRGSSLNGIRFDSDRAAVPTSANDVILFRYGSALHFWDGSSDTTLGSAGGLVNFSLNDGYDDGRTITVDAGGIVLAGATEATGVLQITADGASSGPGILITQSGSGNDITGTSATWGVTKAGAATFASLVGASLTAAASLTIDATDAGTITIAGTSTGAIALGAAVNVAASKALTVAGVEGSNMFVVTAGDAVITLGSLSVTDNDNAESVTIINNTATTIGNASSTGVFEIESTSLTTGALLNLQLTEGTLNGGWYLRAWDATAGEAVFSVAENGVITIAGGTTGTTSIAVTAGDVVLSDGVISGTQSANATALKIVADSVTTTIVVDINADGLTNGTILHLDSSTAGWGTGLYLDCYDGAASEFSVGLDGATIITASGTTTTALKIVANSDTTVTAGVIDVDANALTTGIGMKMNSTSITLTSGELMTLGLTASGSLATKTGNLASISSSMTMTTAGVTENYDMFLLSRTDVANEAGQTLTSQGSTLKVLHTSTQTAGTLTDTSIGVEIEQAGATGFTGSGLQVTVAAVGAKAVNVVTAATTVSSVLITGTGVKANNKADLEVTNNGATAAGGSILRVTNTGTPAAATSYLVDFDYSGATHTNNPVTMLVSTGVSTASTIRVTGSGALAAGAGTLELINTNALAVGAVLVLRHTSASPANSDVTGAIEFWGNDSGAGSQQWGKIHSIITDVTAASEDADLIFSVMKAGTLTVALQLDSDLSGVIVGSGAAAGVVQSSGNFDLTMQTGNATTGTITITDGANGAITLTPNGSGKIDLANAVLMSKTESIGAGVGGAIDVVSSISELATDAGGDAYQLADSAEGQMKFIILKTDGGGDAVITPANFGQGTTITMADAGDAWTGLFTNGKWYTVGQNGCIIA